MSDILAWVFSEQGLTALAGLFGTIYLLLKKKEINGTKVEWDRQIAFDALCVGVLETFQRYIKGLKEKDPENGVSEEIEVEAHEMAKRIANRVAEKKGVNLVNALGADFIDLHIKNIVEDMKTKGILKIKKKLNND